VDANAIWLQRAAARIAEMAQAEAEEYETL